MQGQQCEICVKTFVLLWRLRKHQSNHGDENQKKCHYFNNQKHCLFEALGCKFAHKQSENCKFDKKCSNKLCPFRHGSLESEKETNDTKDAFDDSDTDYSYDEEDKLDLLSSNNWLIYGRQYWTTKELHMPFKHELVLA